MADLNTYRNEGGGGTYVVNDTAVHTLNFETIQITTTTVIASLKIDGVEDVTNQISTPANSVEGGVITVPYGSIFTEIQLSSGVVILGKE